MDSGGHFEPERIINHRRVPPGPGSISSGEFSHHENTWETELALRDAGLDADLDKYWNANRMRGKSEPKKERMIANVAVAKPGFFNRPRNSTRRSM